MLLDNGRTQRPARRGRPPGPPLHPLQRLPQRLPRLLAHRRPRVRVRLPGPDRRDPDAAAPRDRERRLAAVRVEPLRRLLRGLPGQDRHPGGAAPPSRARRSRRRRRGASGRRCATARPASSRAPAASRWRSALGRLASGRSPGAAASGGSRRRSSGWTRSRDLRPPAARLPRRGGDRAVSDARARPSWSASGPRSRGADAGRRRRAAYRRGRRARRATRVVELFCRARRGLPRRGPSHVAGRRRRTP